MRPESNETGSTPGAPADAAAPKRITRRRFLGAATLALAASAGGIAVLDWLGLRTWARWQMRGVENYARAYSWAFLEPAERIRRHFDYLSIDEEGLQRFVADYERHYGKVTPRATAANRVMYTKFLMSTDFFRNGADERKPVRYVALYDPYVSPCYVPFPIPRVDAGPAPGDRP